jgi:formate dehydrogenase major subunit
MDKITLKIDNLEIITSRGKYLLDVALENGIYIPHLCHHPDLDPMGLCRLCMVEIEGKGMKTSCKMPAEEGMVVRTETPEINEVRKISLELLIVNHNRDCLPCAKDTLCKLQDAANYIGIDKERLKRYRKPTRSLEPDSSNPFFILDHNKCVLCGICVRTCDEVQGARAIDFAYRGYETKISAFANRPLVESNCESCGECVVRCPVGALIPKHTQQPSREVRTICPYCGCGCGMYLGLRGERVVKVSGDYENPSNLGRLCVKGRFGYDFINHPEGLGKYFEFCSRTILQIRIP